MTGRASRRAACAVIGAVLALSAALFPPVALLPSRSPHEPAGHAVAARPFPATAARPAPPTVRSAHLVHRLLGFAVDAGGSPATPPALVGAALGLLVMAGTPGRTRLGGDRRRPRGPPARRPAPAA